ncbi:MAG: iron-sulfur cluster assembly scaffold protein [Candidatus Dependentiae bacterium]
MYQEELMDHYQHPRHRGILTGADFDSGQYNPSCGDAVTMQGKITNDVITHIAFEGKGCVISQATASMLAEYALGKPIDELSQFSVDDMLQLIKIPLGPTRLKCALLSLHALKEGIKQFQQKGL